MRILFKTSGFVIMLTFLVLVSEVSVRFATAEEVSVSGAMSLEQVLAIVTDTHPEILEIRSQYRSILAERSIAKSGYLPKVGTTLAAGQEVTDGEDTNNNRENLTVTTATLYARQNLYNGGKTAAFINETDTRILAAAYEVLNVVNRVYLETSEAYLQVLQTRKKLELSELNVLTQERILEQVREKTDSGFNRISDLKNSEARLALARSNYISRQQDLNQAMVQFHHQLGRFVKTDNFIIPEPAFQLPETVEATIDIALKNHPALNVAKYNTQVRKYSYEKTKADYWPTVDLELKAQHRENTGGDEGETDQLSAMLSLNYTFFDGGVRKGEKFKAFESLHKENQRAYVERRNVNKTARLAWNIVQAERLKKKYLTSYVNKSQQTLEAFKEEYYIGRRTLIDLLSMENEHNAANNAKVDSDFSYLVAYYRISQATGILLHEFDTGLRDEMHLPSTKLFNLKKYNDLDTNRDVDNVEDIVDQCDNSIKGSVNPVYGCNENSALTLGYQEPTEISPYILPKKGTPKELDMKIDKRKEEQSIHLNMISFKSDSDELTEETKEIMVYVADQLNATDFFSVEVIGHTDNTGSSVYNMKLSRARAKSVYEELVNLGVNKDSIQWSGRGEEEPVAANNTEEGKSKNRRTEFKLIKKQPEE